MNFKSSKLKVILSIILGMMFGFYYLDNFYEPQGLIDVLGPIVFIISSAVGASLIYIIWSLIQKK